MPVSPVKFAFIDSNLWLYGFLKTEDAIKSKKSNELIKSLHAAVSTQVINEVCSNLLKRPQFDEEFING